MDNAERLGTALYGHDAPEQKLLGGADAEIFADAADKIAELESEVKRVDRMRDKIRKLQAAIDEGAEGENDADDEFVVDALGEIIATGPEEMKDGQAGNETLASDSVDSVRHSRSDSESMLAADVDDRAWWDALPQEKKEAIMPKMPAPIKKMDPDDFYRLARIIYDDDLPSVSDMVGIMREEDAETLAKSAIEACWRGFEGEVGIKLQTKQAEGYAGWDDAGNFDMISRKLQKNYREHDYIDVAACAMMLWNFRNGVVYQEDAPTPGEEPTLASFAGEYPHATLGRAEDDDWPPTIETVGIPEGEFLYGKNKETVILPAFEMAKYPLTNAQYEAYRKAAGAHPEWTMPECKENHPAVYLSWQDAVDCAEWYGMRLPTEQEWEKAARGTDGQKFPWGDDFDKNRCNTAEAGCGNTLPVSTDPSGASPYGCCDMTGNVWEWTESLYENHEPPRVVRGGSWFYGQHDARCAGRLGLHPGYRYLSVGVRFSRSI